MDFFQSFYLPVDLGCCCCGWIVGLFTMAVFVIATAARPDAAQDRAELLALLVENEVKPVIARKIVEKGVCKWARWRAKTRPYLWRIGMEWPEYSPASKDEFRTVYEHGLPEETDEESAQEELGLSSEPGTNGEDSPDDSQTSEPSEQSQTKPDLSSESDVNGEDQENSPKTNLTRSIRSDSMSDSDGSSSMPGESESN